ncbi:unnamed protein product [Strongylus vulgaris]|uniref:Hyaluronidase n=1 Tax=Strongylus vulgaris TaxID=40348 RepID=A0A3P7KSP8_STRVU|nr:unnamed protein product [Strongylus vulgaris]
MTLCITLTLLTITLPRLLVGLDVYWNFPAEQCQNNSTHHINFQTYKIKENTNYTFQGDKIVIFYESKFGLYPYYKKYNASQPINGGLPQKCSLDAHLAEVEKNITNLIPNEEFDGLAVIDLEEWRPRYNQNDWGAKQVFQNQSILLAKELHPGLKDQEIKKTAEEEFNKASE